MIDAREIAASLYKTLIHKDERNDCGVSFPDFLGCVTARRTVAEACANAAEALAFHIKGMIKDGEALPEPNELSMPMRDRDGRDAVGEIFVLL